MECHDATNNDTTAKETDVKSRVDGIREASLQGQD